MNNVLQNFNDLFSKTKYNDDFGWSSDWNKEIEKWLVFAKTLNKSWYNTGKGRVNNAKQRDELIMVGSFEFLLKKIGSDLGKPAM